jgi:hypothetical protein
VTILIYIQSSLSCVTFQGNIEIESHKRGGHLNYTGLINMKCTEGKLKLRSHNRIYCLIDVITKAGLTVIGIILIFHIA